MKRVRISKKWQKIMSVTGTKMVRYMAVAMICAMIIPGCTPIKETSWEAYCRLYKVDSEKPSEEQENYYYDVWLETDEAMKYMENN